MVHAERPSFVKWDQHFEQELLVFGFQWQSKPIDDTKHTHTHTHTTSSSSGSSTAPECSPRVRALNVIQQTAQPTIAGDQKSVIVSLS